MNNMPSEKQLKYWESLKGKKQSEETKRKRALKMFGKKFPNRKKPKPMSAKTKKKISVGNKGKPKSEIAKLNMSISSKGKHKSPNTEFKKGQNLGKNNYAWKGGVTPLQVLIRHSYKMRQWISDNFTRDDYTCMVTGIRGGKLVVHHIKPFAKILKENNITTYEQAMECEELWNINNGITLSKEIHQEIHRKNE